jgi:cell division protease FtsH
LSRKQVLEVFATVQKRPLRGSYTGYGKRLPSDRPPVLTPKELALAAASDSNGANGSAITGNGSNGSNGNGQGLGYSPNGGTGELPGAPAKGDE